MSAVRTSTTSRGAAVRIREPFPLTPIAGLLAVVLTGVARAWRELGGIAHVLDSTFGRLLAVKVGLVLVALLATAGMTCR